MKTPRNSRKPASFVLVSVGAFVLLLLVVSFYNLFFGEGGIHLSRLNSRSAIFGALTLVAIVGFLIVGLRQISSVERRPREAKSGSPKPVQLRDGKSHIPFCFHCNTHVSPQVAVVSEKRIGGIIDTGGPVDLFVTRGNEKVRKFCPHCGNEVFSRDEIQAKEESDGCSFLFKLAMIIVSALIAILIATSNR